MGSIRIPQRSSVSTEIPLIVNEPWPKTHGAKVSIIAAGDDARGVTVQLTHLRWDS